MTLETLSNGQKQVVSLSIETLHERDIVSLQVAIRESGDVAILDLRGRSTISGGESQLLSTYIQKLVADGKRKLLLNLTDLTQVDSWPSRPGELHPGPLTDPDVNLSIHPARATLRRLPPSAKTRSSSGCPLTPS